MREGGVDRPRRPLRVTALRAVWVAYVALLLLAAWPVNLRPAAIGSLSNAGLVLLSRFGITAGATVFRGSDDLQRWWRTHLCLEVTARESSGAVRVARFACPPAGLRVVWDPVEELLYHWLILASNPGGDESLYRNRLGAGVHWLCGADRWQGRAVEHVRLETLVGEIDYETGAQREQRTTLIEARCG